jgi:hypothetical protein
MADFGALHGFDDPFPHWIADDFIDAEEVRAINAQWPRDGSDGWRVETGVGAASKGSMLFPRRLPPAAQALAERLNGPRALRELSKLVGLQLQADPWLHDGPLTPALGGGLHEIHRGGMLNVHVDFEQHPSGLRRVANLLIYLNEDWSEDWGGRLELHGKKVKAVAPFAGRAVLFVTDPDSWHGHPAPLACPSNRTRRSLALYYYAESDDAEQRPKTVYRSKR